MRSFLILVTGVFVAALGFGIYWIMSMADPGKAADGGGTQKPRPVAVAPRNTTLPSMDDDGKGIVKPGEVIRWDKYDPKFGRLTSRLEAASYESMKDGRMLVQQPVAEFYMNNGQVMRIRGKTGHITMQETIRGGGRAPAAGNAQAPRSGELFDVVLFTLPDMHATEAQALLRMEMPNASFDNETFRIQTESYRENGQLIPADRVPITIRGVDYWFDGRGLKLQYNEVDHRLESLRVAQGERLIIRNPKLFNRGEDEAKEEEPKKTPPAGVGRFVPVEPIEDYVLVAAEPRAAGRPTTRPRGPATRRAAAAADAPKEDPVYRATFRENVDIYEGEGPDRVKIGTAEELQVDFLSKDGELDLTTGGAAAAETVKKPTTPRAPAAGAARKPPAPRREAAASTTRPKQPKKRVAQSTSRPTTRPIEILWKGPLTIVPLPGDRPERIAPGEAIVKMTGSAKRPVTLLRDEAGKKSLMKCAVLTHHTLDRGTVLDEGPGLPVEMIEIQQGVVASHIVTHSMTFSEETGTAILTGRSTAKLPMQDGTDKKPELMDVSWADRCTLYFAGSIEDMVVQRADLRGAVAVKHPALNLTAQNLDLYLSNDAPTTRPTTNPSTTRPSRSASPALRQLDANGSVKAVVQGPGGPEDLRKIEAETLKLTTATGPDGKLFARELNASKSVHMLDPEREMWAEYVNITLAPPAPPAAKPTTRPATRPGKKKLDMDSGELESLFAHDKVKIITHDGKQAFANVLAIEVKDKLTRVTLHGLPATVKTSEKDVITGNIITMIPETQHVVISGEGRMKGVHQPNLSQAGQPFDINWTRSLEAKDDVIELLGGVAAKMTDAEGAVNTATGERAILTTTRPVKKDDEGGGEEPKGELDAMGGRVVTSVTLKGAGDQRAVSESTLTDEHGKLQRLFHVDSDTIQYFSKGEKQRELIIPGEGKMLFADLRPPADSEEAKAAADDQMNIRGRTAFQWNERLVYDEKASTLTMTGGVQIARLPAEGENLEPLRLTGEFLVADIVPAERDLDGNRLAGGINSKMQLKKVHVEASDARPVRVTGKNLDVEAVTIDYEPAKHLLIARGKDRRRVRQFDVNNGLESASFDEFIYNTKTGEVKSTGFRASSTK